MGTVKFNCEFEYNYILMKFNLSVLQKTTLFLLVYLLIGSYFVVTQNILSGNGSLILANLALHFAVIFGVGLGTHYACAYFFGKKKIVLNAIISLLLLAMLVHYPLSLAGETLGLNLLTSGLLAFVMIAYKNFLEYKNLPLVNPLVFALLLGAFLLPTFGLPPLFVSWWAADFKGLISLALVLLWLLTWFRPWRKFPSLLAFLLTNLVMLLLLGSETSTISYMYTHATLYFLAGFMLTEPKTSPANLKEQIIYGVVVAVVINLSRVIGLQQADLIGIAVGNLAYAAYRFRPKPQIKQTQVNA
jgi:hypothetical protein